MRLTWCSEVATRRTSEKPHVRRRICVDFLVPWVNCASVVGLAHRLWSALMRHREEIPSINRRFRRSSDRMVALWCLFEHARKRYCLRSVVLIDDFGTELVSSGEDILSGASSADSSESGMTQSMVSIPLPGRALPGLLVVHAPTDVLRPALDDLQEGLGRIFEEQALEQHEQRP